MKHKFLALALALTIVAGLLPMSASAASITESEVNQKLEALLAGTAANGQYKAGTPEPSCFIFAVNVFNYIFGTNLIAKGYPNAEFSNTQGMSAVQVVDHLGSNNSSSSFSEAQFISLVKKAKPGDLLLLANPGSSQGHAMIIWSVAANGTPTVYDANWKEEGKVSKHEYGWAYAKSHNGAATLYHYKDYTNGTTTPKTTITFSSLTVPSTLTEGSDALLDGSFTSTNSKICNVKAEVCDAASGTAKLSATSGGNFSVWTYGPLTNSKLNTDLDLGKLKAGTYYVRYTVTTQDGTTASKSTANFTVKAKTCTAHTKGTFKFYEAVHPHYNYWQCSVCGANFTDGSTAKMDSCTICNSPCANGHSWGSWTTTKAASCGVAGSRKRTCLRCSKVETETIAALSHNYQKTSFTAYNIFTCSNCKDSYRVDTVSWVEMPPSENDDTRSVGLRNSSDKELQCHFIAACYEGGRLVSLTEKSLRLPPNSSQSMYTPIPLETGSSTWKVFVLDSNALAPILPELEY